MIEQVHFPWYQQTPIQVSVQSLDSPMGWIWVFSYLDFTVCWGRSFTYQIAAGAIKYIKSLSFFYQKSFLIWIYVIFFIIYSQGSKYSKNKCNLTSTFPDKYNIMAYHSDMGFLSSYTFIFGPIIFTVGFYCNYSILWKFQISVQSTSLSHKIFFCLKFTWLNFQWNIY